MKRRGGTAILFSFGLTVALGLASCGTHEIHKSAMMGAQESAPSSTRSLMTDSSATDISLADETPMENGATRETYAPIVENAFMSARSMPRSTFSIDVDAASYSNVRRFITAGSPPPADAVRIEELINYFHYDYPQPSTTHPFSITTDVAQCPWNSDHQLVLIGLQGRSARMESVPPSNLVFLIDVSGSMQSPDKLDLVKKSFRYLVAKLRDEDRVSLVVYAGAAGLVLPPTKGTDRQTILNAIDNLEAGGSTAGGEGIQLAYNAARSAFIENGNNRVILATDGDFNVGISDIGGLERLIEAKRKEGIFLTVLGVGRDNLQDATLEMLADKGNGHYAYLDTEREARKVFETELTSTLFTIAKDVKIQVEFNPSTVLAYRLIGYENRRLANEDFENDAKDAGELGAGHNVTALYEIVPAGASTGGRPDLIVEGTDRQQAATRDNDFTSTQFGNGDILSVKLRYKLPNEETSRLVTGPAVASRREIGEASENLRFAAAVAEWGLLLRNSKHKGNASFDDVLNLARSATGTDIEGYRTEFISLVEQSRM